MDKFILPDNDSHLKIELTTLLKSNVEDGVQLIIDLKNQLIEERLKNENLEKELKAAYENLSGVENQLERKTQELKKMIKESEEIESSMKNEINHIKLSNQSNNGNSEKMEDLKINVKETKKRITAANQQILSLESKLSTANKKIVKQKETIDKMHETIEKNREINLKVKNLEDEKKALSKQIRIANLDNKKDIYKKTDCHFHKEKDEKNVRSLEFINFKNKFELKDF